MKVSKETKRSIIAIWIAITLLTINQLYGAYQNRQAHQLLWDDLIQHMRQDNQRMEQENQYLEKLNQVLEKQNQLLQLYYK